MDNFDFHLECTRDVVFLSIIKGEGYSFEPIDTEINNYIKISENICDRLHNDEGIFLPGVPSHDMIFPWNANNLPDFVKKPLIKKKSGTIRGFSSGVRSAILSSGNDSKKKKYYRLKGCGNNYDGFPTRKRMGVNGKEFTDIRGIEFGNTCIREQIMTMVVNEKMTKAGIAWGNKPIGAWKYDVDLPVEIYCGLFETRGELRVSDDILYALEKCLVDFFPSLQKDSPMMDDPCIYIPYEKRFDPIDTNAIPSFLANIHVEIPREPPKEVRDPVLRQAWEAYSKMVKENDVNLADLYWTIGYFAGKIKRLLEDECIMWGTYYDWRDYTFHCNSHANNLVLVENDKTFNIAPIDFDLAYPKVTFVNLLNKENIFEKWLENGYRFLQDTLASSEAVRNSDLKQLVELPSPWDKLRKILREMITIGFQSGYGLEPFENKRIGYLELIGLALILSVIK